MHYAPTGNTTIIIGVVKHTLIIPMMLFGILTYLSVGAISLTGIEQIEQDVIIEGSSMELFDSVLLLGIDI